jgi:hypothetical protein
MQIWEKVPWMAFFIKTLKMLDNFLISSLYPVVSLIYIPYSIQTPSYLLKGHKKKFSFIDATSERSVPLNCNKSCSSSDFGLFILNFSGNPVKILLWVIFKGFFVTK